MKYLLVSLVVLNISDALVTHLLVKFEIANEGNSLLSPMVGEPAFFALKFFGALLAAVILWDLYRRRPWITLITTSCIVTAYSLLVVWNLNLFQLGLIV